jgi:hypothetical protein
MKATIELIRDKFLDNCTLGKLYINGKYICETLEDKDRGLHSEMTVEEIGKIKVKAQTAIPTGTYKMIFSVSKRFKKLMPELLAVKGFAGIRIHSGNKPEDSEGCILLGITRGEGVIGTSKVAIAHFENELDAFKEFEIVIKRNVQAV